MLRNGRRLSVLSFTGGAIRAMLQPSRSKEKKMKIFEIECTASSAYYSGAYFDAPEHWTRPAIAKVCGTAGNLLRYVYGYITEIRGEDDEFSPAFDLPYGTRWWDLSDIIKENDPNVA